MAETREAYENLIDTKKAIAEELWRPRCEVCDNNALGHCIRFDVPIPEEHRFTYTECAHYVENIPF